MPEELTTSSGIRVPLDEIELSAVRSSGAGGQNVNKVATAIHLRFDVRASSLPAAIQKRLIRIGGSKVSNDDILIFKAQNHRTQERNRREALERLADMIDEAAIKPVKRIPTRPSRAAKARRVNEKKQRGAIKKLRAPVKDQ